MESSEALQSLIHDVSTSFASMKQDLSPHFSDPDRDRAGLLHQEVRELYTEGAYVEASEACEQLIALLEEVEMKYMFWLEKNDMSSIQDDLYHDLDLVKTDPEKVVVEMEGYKKRMHTLTITQDSWMYRIVYHNLLRLELVLLLVLMTLISLMLGEVRPSTPPMRYLVALGGVIGIGIWLLRIMRHSWGVITLITLGVLGVLWHMVVAV